MDYSGRDIVIVLPFKTTAYDIASLAVVDTLAGRVMGEISLPPPQELEAHPISPSLGQNQQWWPEQTPPPGTPRPRTPPSRTTPGYYRYVLCTPCYNDF